MTQLADTILETVRRVTGDRNEFVPLHEPEFTGNELTYVTECIETGWVSSVGSFVDRFEADLAAFTGARHAVVTVNGTAALHVALILAGVRPGDEVLLPTLTFIATANATSYAGATPHFVDSELETLAVDPVKLQAHLSQIADLRGDGCYNTVTGARIGALIVMHPFGHPAKLDELAALAERWRIPLVEDAAESLGTTYKGRHTGNTGLVSALSFNGNKVLTTGGGGAILTNDAEIARRAKHLTTTARVADRWNFLHDEVGFNYRLPNINAALGVAQLERLPGILARKRRLAERYDAALEKVDGVRFFREPPGSTSNFWLCTAILDQADEETLTGVLETLNGAGLMSRPLWTLMHRLPMYAGAPRADLSCAEDLAARVINLPSSPKLVSEPGPAT
jgi:perosamine synthetase